MAVDKKSFILYSDLIGVVSKLPNDKAGELFKIILEYVNDLNPKVDDLLLEIAFEPIKLQLKRSLKQWEQERSKRSDAGKKGMESRWHNIDKKEITKHNSVIKPITKITDNVNVSVNVNDNVNVINKKSKPKKNIFLPPTLLDVENYFIENGFSKESAIKAFNFYNIADWHDTKGNKVKNWKQKMQGVWFKEENKEKEKSSVKKEKEFNDFWGDNK